MTTTFKISCVAVSESDQSHKIILKLSNAKTNGRSYLSIPLAELRKPLMVAEKLVNHGIEVPRENEKAKEFVREKIEKQLCDSSHRPVTTTTGWHTSGVFVTPSKTFGWAEAMPLHASRLDRLPTKPLSDHNIEGWKSALGPLAKHSHTTVFAVAHALSGPLLQKCLKCSDVPVVNLWSDTSSGKSTVLRIANSCYEPPSSQTALPTFNHTGRAREEALTARNGLFLPIDEENLSQESKKFIFEVASGQGRARSKAVHDTLPDVRWVCAILTSANRPIVARGSERGPQFVRIIDMKIGSSDEGGIFDRDADDLSAEERSAIIDRAVNGCQKCSGGVGAAWLAALTHSENQKEYFAYALSRHKAFLEKYSVGLGNAEIRVLEKFANVFAAASLSAKLEIVPWTAEDGEKSIRWCYRRHVRQNPENYQDLRQLIQKLQEVLRTKSLFLRKGIGADGALKRRATSLGFHTRFSGKAVACVWDRSLDALGKRLGCQGVILRSLLIRNGILMQDAERKRSIFSRDPLTGKRRRFATLDLRQIRKKIEG
jgi:hypothetical protein